MKEITINTQSEFDALKNSNGDVHVKSNLLIRCDIRTIGNIYAIGYIRTIGNIYASDIIAGGDIYASDIIAGGNIIAGVYIKANGYIRAIGYIDADLLYTSCIYPPQCSKLKVDRVIPAEGANDREYWAERFGIDTSKGCYDEFSERLREALPRLKQMQNWSPLELLIIESHEGKYK